MKGSTSAKKTDGGLEVTCRCGETFTLSSEGGERTCGCGWLHHYDGMSLKSTSPLRTP